MRSFSNLWYWIALAVLWSTVSHWVLGVPFDMVTRARRQQGQALEDLDTLVRINTDRMVYIADTAGIAIVGFGSTMLTILAALGWGYSVEFAQAVFLLAFPMSLVGLMSVATARRIRTAGLRGAELVRALSRHRFWTQLLGVLAIFVTSLWGMYKNLAFAIHPG